MSPSQYPTSIDYFTPRPKNAVQFIPILVGLGISGALATGSASMGIEIKLYSKKSQQLDDDVQTIFRSVSLVDSQRVNYKIEEN